MTSDQAERLINAVSAGLFMCAFELLVIALCLMLRKFK